MLVTPSTQPVARIKAIGVGGCGGNAINTMISQYNIEGVDFLAVNTDVQALHNSLAPVTIALGDTITKGLGAGGNWEIGEKAAEESIDQLQEALAGSDMVFITAGMGGGTGTGAAPVIGRVCKELGALTVAVVTKPFRFEGKRKMDSALEGIERLRDNVDTLIVVPNQRILEIVDKNMSFMEAMRKGDEVLIQAVRAISSLVTQTGYINVDFADVKSIMINSGSAHMGIGSATGENRAETASNQAISSPLLEMSINGARGVLLNIIGGSDMTMHEIDVVAEKIQSACDPDVELIFGSTIDEELGDELQVIALATGFDVNKSSLAKNNDVISSENNVVQRSSTSSSPTLSVSSNSSTSNDDLDDLDKPAFLRVKRP